MNAQTFFIASEYLAYYSILRATSFFFLYASHLIRPSRAFSRNSYS